MQRQTAALKFLLYNVISSGQPGINQRLLILSEWLWEYLETLFLLLEVMWGAVAITGVKTEKKKTFNGSTQVICFNDLTTNLPHCSCSTHFIWMVTPPVLSPVIQKMAPFPSKILCEKPNNVLSTYPICCHSDIRNLSFWRMKWPLLYVCMYEM